MVPCLVLGDSLAVGVGQYRPDCTTIARAGIGSGAYVSTMLPPGTSRARTAVISLGVNDGNSPATLDNLQALRDRVDAETVYWLLPGILPEVREKIFRVAYRHGDMLIETAPLAGPDRLHPTGAGYRFIAGEAR